jgi:CcmD family protein
MSSRSFLSALVLCAASLSSASAWAQDTVKPVVQFAEPAMAAPDSSDPKQLLAACDNRVEACERDAVGVPFLAAAYMAIWTILFVFLIITRRGQRRLELELKELERRLDGPGGSTA